MIYRLFFCIRVYPLLLQDEPVPSGDAEPVAHAGVLDPDLLLSPEQVRGGEKAWRRRPRPLGRRVLAFGFFGHESASAIACRRLPALTGVQ